MVQLGVNALCEVLEPGRVPDCYLGLLLNPPSGQHSGGVLVVRRPRGCTPASPNQTAPCCTGW